MKHLTSELIEKAKTAKSAEELLRIAKENGIDMTADDAVTYFEQINANSLEDDLLDRVSGGWIIFADESKDSDNQRSRRGGNRESKCR